MALVGGGGAPNVAGGNPAGTGTTLNYVSDFVYAHSGVIDVDNNETTLLDFTTSGSGVIEATFSFFYIENQTEDYLYQVKFNNEIILGYNVDSSKAFQKDLVTKLVIPPETRVTVTATNVSNTNSREQTATIVGRVYA